MIEVPVKYLGVLAGIAVTSMFAYSYLVKPPVGPPAFRAKIYNFGFEVR